MSRGGSILVSDIAFNPVKGVLRPAEGSNEGKTSALLDDQAKADYSKIKWTHPHCGCVWVSSFINFQRNDDPLADEKLRFAAWCVRQAELSVRLPRFH